MSTISPSVVDEQLVRHLPTEEDVERAVPMGNLHGRLNFESLRRGARAIFAGETGLPPSKYDSLVKANYRGFDLHRHGLVQLIQDIRLHCEMYLRATRFVSQKNPANRKRQILHVGVGPGREAVTAIQLARLKDRPTVVFNDLLPEHIDATRDVIGRAFRTKKLDDDRVLVENQVQVKFVTGDILEVMEDAREEFDVIFALWYVTSEIADYSSVGALRAKRRQLYKRFYDLLAHVGVFVEDVPCSDNTAADTFFYLGRMKTYAILQEMGVLSGENHNMLLSDFSGSLTPEEAKAGVSAHHLRYVPGNGDHQQEVSGAGFESGYAVWNTVPYAIADDQNVRDLVGSPKAIMRLLERHATRLPDVIHTLAEAEERFLHTPRPLAEEVDPLTCVRKTMINTKNEPSAHQ